MQLPYATFLHQTIGIPHRHFLAAKPERNSPETALTLNAFRFAMDKMKSLGAHTGTDRRHQFQRSTLCAT